uniref:Uncharacterized protein n=1 Tax=Moniliophthora roreri TaxID=221103 RepID=A0A0W0FD06_MONRR
MAILTPSRSYSMKMWTQ